MHRFGICCFSVILIATVCYGQSSSSVPESPAPPSVGHGAFPVKVTRTLDSSKLKQGDAIEVETSGSFKLPNGLLVPKGSRLLGHVAVATARSKGDAESQLTLAFEKLNIKDGKQLSLKGSVQAVFPPAAEAEPDIPSAPSHQGAGGAGLSAGSLSTPDYRPTGDIRSGSNTSGGRAEQAVDPASVGVRGIDNLQLNEGDLTSKGKNVKLGSGVRMIVHVVIFG